MKLSGKLATLFLASCAILSIDSCSHKSQKALRVVQYDVGAFSKEIENSIPMISDMMKELGADVISLNELDSCNRRHENY